MYILSKRIIGKPISSFEYNLTLFRPYGSLFHPVVKLLHQVQREVGSESVLVEHDLPGESEVLDLLDVAQHLVPVLPRNPGVAAQRLKLHVLSKG